MKKKNKYDEDMKEYLTSKVFLMRVIVGLIPFCFICLGWVWYTIEINK